MPKLSLPNSAVEVPRPAVTNRYPSGTWPTVNGDDSVEGSTSGAASSSVVVGSAPQATTRSAARTSPAARRRSRFVGRPPDPAPPSP